MVGHIPFPLFLLSWSRALGFIPITPASSIMLHKDVSGVYVYKDNSLGICQVPFSCHLLKSSISTFYQFTSWKCLFQIHIVVHKILNSLSCVLKKKFIVCLFCSHVLLFPSACFILVCWHAIVGICSYYLIFTPQSSLFMLTSSHPMCSPFQIDLRRANNCGIMLTKVKMPLPNLMVRFYLPELFSYYVNLLFV